MLPAASNALNLTRLNTSVSSLVCNSSDFNSDGKTRFVHSAAVNPCTKHDITVASDASRMAPPNFENNDGNIWTNRAHRAYNTSDVYLRNGWYADEPGHEVPSMADLDFHMWVRIPPLPTFRKLLRIIKVDVAPGQYQLEVDEYFDVASFGGEKFLSLESRGRIGGRNYVLAIVYLATGVVAAVLLVATVASYLLIGV